VFRERIRVVVFLVVIAIFIVVDAGMCGTGGKAVIVEVSFGKVEKGGS
jgi:hypothetical protein